MLTTPSSIALGRLTLLGGSVLAVAIGGLSGRALASGLGLAVATILLVVMLRMDDHVARSAGRRRLLPTGAFNPRAPLGAVSLVMALIGGCTMAVVYVPYVVVRVDMHAPITGGYLSSVLPVAWAAAALASASVSAWAHRFIVSGPVLVTLGLILTGWALTTGSLVLIAVSARSGRRGYRGGMGVSRKPADRVRRAERTGYCGGLHLDRQSHLTSIWRCPRWNDREYRRVRKSRAWFDRGRACGLLAIPDDLIVSGGCAALRHSGDSQSDYRERVAKLLIFGTVRTPACR